MGWIVIWISEPNGRFGQHQGQASQPCNGESLNHLKDSPLSVELLLFAADNGRSFRSFSEAAFSSTEERALQQHHRQRHQKDEGYQAQAAVTFSSASS